MNNLSFRQWLSDRISSALVGKQQVPFVIWCDPDQVWKSLLRKAVENVNCEFWSENIHELILRSRFSTEPMVPRVIWLPVSKEEITYFQVFALQAKDVIELSLVEALSQFGVDIPPDQRAELEPLLPAHARQWIDYPLRYWQEHITGGKDILDDNEFLAILAADGQSLGELSSPELVPIFNRRAVEDFGLPTVYKGELEADLAKIDLDDWRRKALAAMLVTEADAANPSNPPGDQDRLIKANAARDRALKLLSRWQKQLDLIDSFENMAQQADRLTSLQYWARSLLKIPAPLSSPAIENTVFQCELERLAKFSSFDDLVDRLEQNLEIYQAHACSFWGGQAKSRVHWDQLSALAEIARLLRQQSRVEKNWQKSDDAVNWYVQTGWKVDQAGETLFRDDQSFPGALVGVRVNLRRAYQRHLDRVNATFSDLLFKERSNIHSEVLDLDFTADVMAQSLQPDPRQPTAVLVLDACRYDVGCRLAETINQGEPAQRAEIMPVQAPVPSITPLGMSFSLPLNREKVKVSLSEKGLQPWIIHIDGFQGNLADASQRREWLKVAFKLKEKAFLSINQVFKGNGDEELSIKTHGRLLFVFGDELDDHDGLLKPFGLNPMIERYAGVIRRLRAAGYSTIFVVADHGFFHWDPDPDEKDLAKPEGELLWKSRRAIVGHHLEHSTAIKLKVTNSKLECCIPRSINAFKTYGGLGFFHGGATLQELVIPLITIRWPQKARKIGAVLKPIEVISSLAQRVQVGPEATQIDLFSGLDENLISRKVMIKVIDPRNGKLIFRSKSSISIDPGGQVQTLELQPLPDAEAVIGAVLELRVLDADDEEILDRREVTLQVELDEWI